MIKFLPIVFMIIPFTKILPIESYNQPYAFLSALFVLLLKPSAFGRLPQIDRLALGYMFLLGTGLFFVAAFEEFSFRLVQYLLVYVSPAIMVAVAFFAMRSDPERVRKLLVYGICAWTFVGLVQRFVSVDFLVFLASQNDDLASNIIDSGRGVLSLAPEPTHFALHMLVMAGALMVMRGPLWAVALAAASALFLAASSFAALVIGFGGLLWAVMRPWRWPLVALFFVGVSTVFLIAQALFSPDTRIGRLIAVLTEFGFAGLLTDASANARIYGIIAPITESFNTLLVPLGATTSAWLDMRDVILAANSQIYSLSGAGPATGYGLILVQGGVLALPVLAYLFARLFWRAGASWRGLPVVIGATVFVGQIYLSTPSFSLLLAAVIFALVDERETARSRSQHQDPARQPGAERR